MNRKNIRKPIAETGFADRNREIYSEYHKEKVKTTGLYWGTVEDDYDPQKQGRLLVNVPELNTGSREPAGKKKEGTKSTGYIWCYPMLPSAGTTDSYGSEDGFSNSYGFWGPQPRKGDIVVVGFINGVIATWLGCIPKPRKNFQIPGVPGADHPNEEYPAPVSEKAATNEDDRQILDDLNQRIKNAGLANDRIRGIGTSGSTRESPSRVAGMLTPGHPKDGVPGHSFIMDDLPDQQGVRLRTSRGHQITFSDVSDSIYVATGQGNSWVEIGDDGKIDVYSKDSISIHTESDLNVRTDGDYILDVAGDFLHKVGGDYKLEVAGNTDETFAGYVRANIGSTYDIATVGNYKLVSNARVDTISSSTTSIASSAQLLVFGTGIVGIDSGATVQMEQGIASMPNYTSSATSMSTTVNSIGALSTDLPQVANSINTSSLIGGIDSGVLGGVVTSLGTVATENGLSVTELSGLSSAMASNGLDVSVIPGELQNSINILNSPNIAQTNILSGLGLSVSDYDVSTLGISQVFSNINAAGISQYDASQLFGSNIGPIFSNITTEGSAITSVNSALGNVEMNTFRDKANGIAARLTSDNLSEIEASAMVSRLADLNNPRVDVDGVMNNFTQALESPNASQLDIMKRIGIDPSTINIGTDGIDIQSALGILEERGLTLEDAKGLFGREYGTQALSIINGSTDVSSIISNMGQLDASALSNILGGSLGDYGQDLANVTGVISNLNLGNVDVGSLGGVVDSALTGAASSTTVPTQNLPGPPSAGQAQESSPGTQAEYAARRVPQHEPWKPDGRIVPQAVATTEPGQKSASDRGVETEADRAPSTGDITGTGTETGSRDDSGPLEEDDIEYLVVHCSATPVSPNYNKASIERYHTGVRGWSTIGYHYVIEYDGSVSTGIAESVVGKHVGAGGVNRKSIAVCLIGGVDSNGNAAHNFRSVQMAALNNLLNELEGKYPSATLKGHRDFNHLYTDRRRRKDCPSFNVQYWRSTGQLTQPNA